MIKSVCCIVRVFGWLVGQSTVIFEKGGKLRFHTPIGSKRLER